MTILDFSFSQGASPSKNTTEKNRKCYETIKQHISKAHGHRPCEGINLQPKRKLAEVTNGHYKILYNTSGLSFRRAYGSILKQKEKTQ
jgi:hypothetical protein